MKKTIDEMMIEILGEKHLKTVRADEFEVLDECAARLGAKQLMELETRARHDIILDALEKSPLFQRSFSKPNNNQTELGKCYFVV